MTMQERQVPEDPLGFITRCLKERKIIWTYHVNMRIEGRGLSRVDILGAIDTLEVIEEYPDDKYLPSYLLYGIIVRGVFHIQIAVDLVGDNVRIVTVYWPDSAEWEESLKRRKR